MWSTCHLGSLLFSQDRSDLSNKIFRNKGMHFEVTKPIVFCAICLERSIQYAQGGSAVLYWRKANNEWTTITMALKNHWTLIDCYKCIYFPWTSAGSLLFSYIWLNPLFSDMYVFISSKLFIHILQNPPLHQWVIM